MLNPIEKFKVAILHLNRAWNHRHVMKEVDKNNISLINKKNEIIYLIVIQDFIAYLF